MSAYCGSIILLNSVLESSLVALNCEERQREAFIAGSVRQGGLKAEALMAHLGSLCREKRPRPAPESTSGLLRTLAL